jgi:hypothetical protein
MRAADSHRPAKSCSRWLIISTPAATSNAADVLRTIVSVSPNAVPREASNTSITVNVVTKPAASAVGP